MLKLFLGEDTNSSPEKDSLIPTAVVKPEDSSNSSDQGKSPQEVDKLKEIDRMHKEISDKLDKLHTREFRKTVIQPILFLVVLCFLILCYYFFPFGLFIILVFCFIFAWTFPALHIPLWISIVLLVFLGYRFVTGVFTWTWLPRQG